MRRTAAAEGCWLLLRVVELLLPMPSAKVSACSAHRGVSQLIWGSHRRLIWTWTERMLAAPACVTLLQLPASLTCGSFRTSSRSRGGKCGTRPPMCPQVQWQHGLAVAVHQEAADIKNWLPCRGRCRPCASL